MLREPSAHREAQERPAVDRRPAEQGPSAALAASISASRWPRCRPSAPKQTRFRGGGATSSKRSSASTQPASSWVQATWSPIIAWIGATPSQRSGEPQLERAEPPAERDLPIAVVDHRAGLAACGAQVLGQDRQRRGAAAPVGQPEQVAVEVDPHPLVGVRAVGVDGEPVVDPAQLGGRAAMPLMAASTWSQRLRAGRWSATAGTGRAVVEVVPTVAQTKNGARPAAGPARTPPPSASGRMANASSWATAQPVAADARDPDALLDRRVGLRAWTATRSPGRRAGWPPGRGPLPSGQEGAERRLRAEPWITPPPAPSSGTAGSEQVDHPVEHERLELGAGRAGGPRHPGPRARPRPARRGSPGAGVGREVGEEARGAASG